MTAAMTTPDSAMLAVLVERMDRLTAGLEAMASALGMVGGAGRPAAAPVAPAAPAPEPVVPPQRWTGWHANALRSALRMSQEQFADKLGVSRRTVTNWTVKPTMVPRTGIQQLLDIAWSWADDAALNRYQHLVEATTVVGVA